MKEYSYIKRAIMRELSENSRISVTNLAKKLKCSRNTVIKNMEHLEKEFDLYYTLEFDKRTLGFIQNHIWNIKFGIKPPAEEIEKMFKDDPIPQLVAKTDGDFDLVIKILANNSESYIKWALGTAVKLLEYRPTIKPSLIAMIHAGFAPVQNETIREFDGKLLGIDSLDKQIIMLLNDNSRLTYRAIARELKCDVETVRYRIRKISKMNIIKRYTVLMRKPPAGYGLAFFINYELAPGLIKRYEDAYKYYLDLDRNIPIMNTFQYLALTSGSYLFFGLGSFENEESAIRGAIIAHKQIYEADNPEIAYARITKMIKGYLPVRSTEVEKEYVPIKWD